MNLHFWNFIYYQRFLFWSFCNSLLQLTRPLGGGHLGKGNLCNCNLKKHNKPTAGSILVSRWPFNKLKKIFLGYKDSNEMGE